MRDFSWKVFTNTGNIDAYMLYKDMDADREDWEWELQEDIEDDQAFEG